ncbi:MAG: NADH-quinone oxidoreductase subunit NuoG [Actinobacteria bacterium]|nr:NADH-quinone oxidoreductase subunit NuoG [Actinomycetota bacterium]
MPSQPDLVTFTVDGKEAQVPAGTLLIEAVKAAGVHIPHFCYHPRMKPVGMCRMCLVQVEGPRGMMLGTSCTMPVTEGMVVHTDTDTVAKAQEGVLEFLLLNHPLDCPVCDRGGECPLQDQTMAAGPGESRFVEEKRHYPKPIPISDLVLLDRERCILCARCTRFSDEISGDPLIEFKDRGNATQVNTFPDEPFASYFSGNTVQICPVGALTATPYRFRARPWDLEAVESTCPHCSVGCRISVQASRNEALRFLGVDNGPVNQGWLCDKGRFGFEFLNSGDRLDTPLVRDEDGDLVEASWAEALDRAAAGLSAAAAEGPGRLAGLGGARSTNEEAYAFGRFVRETLGSNHLDAQLGDGLDPRVLAGITPRAAIDDLERARTVLVWAPDLKEELPVLYLRVRRAATELGANLVVVHPRATGLDPVATHTLRYRPGAGTEMLRRLADGSGDLAAVRAALDEGPVVAIIGRPGLGDDPRLAEAVMAFAAGLPDAAVLPVTRRSNVYGAADMGLAPTLLPGRVANDAPGRDAAGILEGLASGDLGGLVLLGSDPATDYVEPQQAAAALDAAGFTVAIDLFLTPSAAKADVVLPALGFAETEGTVTNLEGRVQKVNRLLPGPGSARPAHEILEDLARRMGGSIGAASAEALAAEIAGTAPAYAGITWEALSWGAGREGIVAPGPEGSQPLAVAPEDHAPPPAARDLVLHQARVLYDRGTLTQAGPSLAKLAKEPAAYVHPEDATRFGIKAGAAVRLTGSGGSAELPVVLDPSLVAGTVYVPLHLGAALGAGLEISMEAVT